MSLDIKVIQKENYKLYPCILISKHEPTIVLAYQEVGSIYFAGTVLEQGDGDFISGYYASSWLRDDFIIFQGTLEIKNK